jgi:YHS domain-containing protein
MIQLVFAALLSVASPAPEECLAKTGAFPVVHGDQTYRLATEECRAQFLTDPERYAQLYDALLELEAEGKPLAPATPSLVPS